MSIYFYQMLLSWLWDFFLLLHCLYSLLLVCFLGSLFYVYFLFHFTIGYCSLRRIKRCFQGLQDQFSMLGNDTYIIHGNIHFCFLHVFMLSWYFLSNVYFRWTTFCMSIWWTYNNDIFFRKYYCHIIYQISIQLNAYPCKFSYILTRHIVFSTINLILNV